MNNRLETCLSYGFAFMVVTLTVLAVTSAAYFVGVGVVNEIRTTIPPALLLPTIHIIAVIYGVFALVFFVALLVDIFRKIRNR